MTAPTYILRGANARDVPALAQLAADSFIAKFGVLYNAADLQTFLSESLSEAAVAAELANPARLYQLAEGATGLLGYAKLGLTCGFPQYARGTRAMELKQLYTAPDATGQGIGGALMDWALAQFAAREADEAHISVYSGNSGAHRFYERYGFEKVADITFKVGEQLDPEFLFARLL